MDITDKTLIANAKRDPKKYEEIYRKYASDVFNYFWYRVNHNRDIAEDLMQETFIRAFKHLSRFRERGYSYKTYLLTIAHNVLANYFRSPKPISLEELSDIPVEVAQHTEKKIDSKLLWRAVQRLSPIERDILILYYRKGFPIKDIARICNRSTNAVKIILSRARRKLRGQLALKHMVSFDNTARSYTKPHFLKK